MDETRYVRSGDMDWKPLGTHGLRCKTLSRDAQTGAALNLVDIPVGWRGGGIAHFHDAFEEVYILSGAVTVGAERWFKTADYFYRPAQVVHGHDERSEEGCLALIRSDGALVLNLIHEPSEPDEYSRLPMVDARGHVLHVPTETIAWTQIAELPAAWAIRPLSRDDRSGAMTVMAKVPAGWETAVPLAHPAAWSGYILEGAIDIDGVPFAAGEFGSGPAGGGLMGPSRCESGCTLLIWFEATA